jgi:hypothetical protein
MLYLQKTDHGKVKYLNLFIYNLIFYRYSAFVRFRDLSISHFFCYKSSLERSQQRMDSPINPHQKNFNIIV